MSTLQTWIARGATALVAAVSMLLSYHALALRAEEAAVPGALAWCYPLAVDGLLVIGMLASYVLRSEPRHKRAYAWAVTGIGLLVSEVGNALAGPLRWDLVSLRAVPPLALALSLHLLIVLARRERSRKPTTKHERAFDSEEPARPVLVHSMPEGSRTAQARALLDADPSISASVLAVQTGLSVSSCRRLISERPRTAVSG